MRSLAGFLSLFNRERLPGQEASALRDACLFCEASLQQDPTYQRFRVCPRCRFHYSMTARERIRQIVDPGSFREKHRSLISLDPIAFGDRASYRRRLFRDQRRTGLTEAAVTGMARVEGLPVALVVLDFGFLGGSMGSVVGEKIALAFEMARKKKLPVVAVVSSGGTRLQEGVLSLMQMAKTAIATTRINQARLPYVCVMANPTSGQVYSSFANLADLILAEPGALMGFAPLRVMEETTGHSVPTEAHTAESHLSHGTLDLLVDREQLRDTISTLLDLLQPRYAITPRGKTKETREVPEAEQRAAWERVGLARHNMRPSAIDYVQRMMSSYVELRGDRTQGDDPNVLCGLGTLGGQGVVFVGDDRRHGSGRCVPEGLRKAQRAMRLAAKFEIPLLTLVDTPGADTSLESEERGLGHAVATTLATMADLPTRTIAVIIGEGGSEAALALSVADRILMLQNAIFAPMSPEAAASLVYRDPGRAQELAESLRLTAPDCLALGIVDTVVPEPDEGAHARPDEASRHLERAIVHHLAVLQQRSVHRIRRERYRKFRRMGEYSSHFHAAVAKEVDLLRSYVVDRVLQRHPRLPG